MRPGGRGNAGVSPVSFRARVHGALVTAHAAQVMLHVSRVERVRIIARVTQLTRAYRGVPLGRAIENPKLVGKRCETSVFNDPL